MNWTSWWPARPAFNAFYRWFARNRTRIGRLLGAPGTTAPTTAGSDATGIDCKPLILQRRLI